LAPVDNPRLAGRWPDEAGRATFGSMPVDNATVSVKGRVLYLTTDPELLKRQLVGENLKYDESRPLIDNISTDELTPG